MRAAIFLQQQSQTNIYDEKEKKIIRKEEWVVHVILPIFKKLLKNIGNYLIILWDLYVILMFHIN